MGTKKTGSESSSLRVPESTRLTARTELKPGGMLGGLAEPLIGASIRREVVGNLARDCAGETPAFEHDVRVEL